MVNSSFVSVTSSYNTSACASSNAKELNATSMFAAMDYERTVCYSSTYSDGLDITIPFDSDSTYGSSGIIYSVEVTSDDSDMYIAIDMEPHQRKTIFLGQNIYRKSAPSGLVDTLLGEREVTILDTEPFQADLFYDGKNSDTEALLRIRLSQFANVGTEEKPGTWMDLLAAIGGAQAVIFVVASSLRMAYLQLKESGGPSGVLRCMYNVVMSSS